MKGSTQPSSTPSEYACKICKDSKVIEYFVENEMYSQPISYYKDCECVTLNRYKELYEKSGLTQALNNMTFKNYTTDGKPEIIAKCKEAAINYCKEFDGKQSISIIGQVGAGKTHLCTAICSYLMKYKSKPVLYMQYRDSLTELKQMLKARDSEEDYNLLMNRFKNAPVLYIDDLYKGADQNNSDLRIMFEIINYRYNNSKPIIVSSEFSAKKLLEIDEAIGSRIFEMSKGYRIEIPQQLELNHRLR